MRLLNREVVKGLVVLAVILAAGFWLFGWFVTVFRASDASVQTSIIAAFVATISVLFAFWKDRDKAYKEAHRQQKISIYEGFYDMMFDLIDASTDGEAIKDPSDDPDFMKRWKELRKGVVFYGSPKVIKTLSEFTMKSGDVGGELEVMRRVGRILLAMREDVGLKNSGLTDLSIHQIYVNEDLTRVGPAS